MKIDLSRISICGVHDFKNAIINLSNDMSIYRLKSQYTPPPVYRTVTYSPLRYHSQYDHRVSDGDVRWLVFPVYRLVSENERPNSSLAVGYLLLGVQLYVLLSPCFISFLCLDLYVLGDDSWMGWGSFVTGQTFMCLDPFLNLFLTLSKTF